MTQKVLEVVKAMGKLAVFGYLVLTTLLALYAVFGLWMVERKDGVPAPRPAFSDSEKPADGTPKIKSIEPESVVIGGNRSTITVYGYNFAADDKVRFNGVDRIFNVVSDNELTVTLAAADFTTPGTVAVTVLSGTKSSNTVNFQIRSAASEKVTWQVLCWQRDITQEAWLVLLVLFAGALAACVSALKSFADYAGESKLTQEWYWLYFARPLVGAGLAFIFYAVIRGGFLAGTAADIKAVNPFGLVTVAALVAMFSDKALLKLSDIFDTLFKADDTRGGKLKALAVATPSPLPPATSGQAYMFNLSAKDGAPGYSWTAVTAPPGGLTLNAAGALTGTPPAASAATSFTVQVIDSAGASATKDLELTIN